MSKTATPKQRDQTTPLWKERDDFPRPWTTDTDLEDWEFDSTSDDEPRRAPQASIVVDLDAEQTAWVGEQADRSGLTLSDFLKKLVDDARAAG